MEKKRFVRKYEPLSSQIAMIKLWPSRSGIIHGIKNITYQKELMIITTHCGETFTVNDSRHSRSARWLRNRYAWRPCKKCKIPDWKLEKYNHTVFTN